MCKSSPSPSVRICPCEMTPYLMLCHLPMSHHCLQRNSQVLWLGVRCGVGIWPLSGKSLGLQSRGQHIASPCPVPHSYGCSCSSTEAETLSSSLTTSLELSSSPGTMGKLFLGTYMASQNAGAVFSQRKALEQGVAEGQFRRQCCPQLEHCSREVPAMPWDRMGAPTRCRNSVLSFFLLRHRAAATLFFSRRLFLLSSSSSSYNKTEKPRSEPGGVGWGKR